MGSIRLVSVLSLYVWFPRFACQPLEVREHVKPSLCCAQSQCLYLLNYCLDYWIVCL